MEKSKKRRVMYYIFVIMCCSIFAIGFHAMLPSDVNLETMDGFLVELFGFPAVAVFYFIILYIHCSISLLYYGKRADCNPWEIGMRYGLAYGLIYFVGMFEIVPGSKWNIEIGMNQFFIGIGDMVPVLILMLLLSRGLSGNSKDRWHPLIRKRQFGLVATVAAVCFIVRIICYLTGIMGSAIYDYPVPVILWTGLWALIFGVILGMLSPLYETQDDGHKVVALVVITLGANWVWFNLFMALIMKGFLVGALVRTSIDVLAVWGAVIVYGKRADY